LSPSRQPIWNACSILSTSILRVSLTTGMDIMRHSGMFTQALALWWILCLSNTSTVLTLCFIWTWRMPLFLIVLTISNCIKGPKVKLAS
jgi:hypothetical protein